MFVSSIFCAAQLDRITMLLCYCAGDCPLAGSVKRKPLIVPEDFIMHKYKKQETITRFSGSLFYNPSTEMWFVPHVCTPTYQSLYHEHIH